LLPNGLESQCGRAVLAFDGVHLRLGAVQRLRRLALLSIPGKIRLWTAIFKSTEFGFQNLCSRNT